MTTSEAKFIIDNIEKLKFIVEKDIYAGLNKKIIGDL